MACFYFRPDRLDRLDRLDSLDRQTAWTPHARATGEREVVPPTSSSLQQAVLEAECHVWHVSASWLALISICHHAANMHCSCHRCCHKRLYMPQNSSRIRTAQFRSTLSLITIVLCTTRVPCAYAACMLPGRAWGHCGGRWALRCRITHRRAQPGLPSAANHYVCVPQHALQQSRAFFQAAATLCS